MTGWLIFAGYVIVVVVVWRRAAWALARGDNSINEQGEWVGDGEDFVVVMVFATAAAIFWPVIVPIWAAYVILRGGLGKRVAGLVIGVPRSERRRQELRRREREVEERERRIRLLEHDTGIVGPVEDRIGGGSPRVWRGPR